MERDDQAAIDFTCPRCGTGAQARFYGPCRVCRDQLVAALAGPDRAVEATQFEATRFEPARFEPAMHVVPNQVATKE